MASGENKAPGSATRRRTSVVREYVEALIVAAVFLGFTNNFVLKTFYIPSGSMEDTLLIGDHLFVNRYIFGPRPTTLEKKLLPGRDVQRGRHRHLPVARNAEDRPRQTLHRPAGR